eukprot:SAG11_NODE_254_length_11587_cov_4.312913_1_plen_190_part_00
MAMGFPDYKCAKALRESADNVETAANYIMTHLDNEDDVFWERPPAEAESQAAAEPEAQAEAESEAESESEPEPEPESELEPEPDLTLSAPNEVTSRLLAELETSGGRLNLTADDCAMLTPKDLRALSQYCGDATAQVFFHAAIIETVCGKGSKGEVPSYDPLGEIFPTVSAANLTLGCEIASTRCIGLS